MIHARQPTTYWKTLQDKDKLVKFIFFSSQQDDFVHDGTLEAKFDNMFLVVAGPCAKNRVTFLSF